MSEKIYKKEDRKPLKVHELLLLTWISLRDKAWAYLGKVSHQETGEILMDLKEAKLAIDSLEAIYDLLKEKVKKEELKPLEMDLTNLRLNFVSLANKGKKEEGK